MNNPVEEYLKINVNKKVSLRYLSKKLNLKKKNIDYLIHQSKKINKINPIEVGSGKNELNVYTYNN
tara:strand:+ start:432 stop:629 length:198 start_codon:yes stop_codon:yes gene_type:complete